jgi:tRNA(Arg) A34 adenosine deaminase TadA
MDHIDYMQMAIDMSRSGMQKGEGGPFGAIVVKDNLIIGKGNNQVILNNDPTAHAEVVAIRDACSRLGNFQLDGCIIYTSCEPCPMCLGAIYWARPDRFFYACTRSDAADIGFDDNFIYQELDLDLSQRSIPASQVSQNEALEVFKEWKSKEIKTLY